MRPTSCARRRSASSIAATRSSSSSAPVRTGSSWSPRGSGAGQYGPTMAGTDVGSPRMPVMPATMSSARFVGREAAFVRLASALEDASGGQATTVLLDGPGGVGVSRVVAELGRRLSGLDESFAVVRGRSYRPGPDEPYGAIVRALRPVFAAVA